MVDQSDDDGLDYRFTLANERTFLAWMRTVLALLATGVALVQFAPDLGSQRFREICAVTLMLVGSGTAAGGLWRWRRLQRDMVAGVEMRAGRLPVVLALVLTLVGLALVVAVLWQVA